MREDLKNIIMVDQTQADGSTGVIFKSYAAVDTLGKHIFASLKKQVVEEKGCKVFFIDDREKKTGYLSNVYGNAGILSLVNRMHVAITDEDKVDLVNNICYTLDLLDEQGYTLSPYLSEQENLTAEGEPLFGKRYPYVGAMTWTLSFLVSVRRATKELDLAIPDEYVKKIIRQIRNIIDHFNSSVICDKAGNPLGWGYTIECEKPSLFFTYSVLEAYSDFEDNIMSADVVDDSLAEKDRELLDAINRKNGDEEIQELWRRKCYAVADNVWRVYKDALKENFLDDTFLEGYRTVTREDILKSNSSNALFNNIYVVFILIYGYVNVRSHEKDDVVMTMNAALQNVQRLYDQLKKEGLEYLVDTYYIPFKSKHLLRGDLYMKRLNAKKLIDATIMPLLVKANNMVAFYISQYPVKHMSSLFDELFDNMSADCWLWESKRYDVKITERYIEAIADFYVYYDTYERAYAERLKWNRALQEQERERLRKKTEAKLRPQLREEISAEVESEKQAIRDSFRIENALRQGIREEVENTLLTAIDRIIAKNSGKEVALTPFEGKLCALLPRLILSYTFGTMRVSADETQAQKLAENLETDARLFLSHWVEKLESSNEVISSLLTKEDK